VLLVVTDIVELLPVTGLGLLNETPMVVLVGCTLELKVTAPVPPVRVMFTV
jgi:hypothetical protein